LLGVALRRPARLAARERVAIANRRAALVRKAS
jgi:hypothetical protein